MKSVAFRYHAVKTIDEAVATLGRVAPEDGRILAGGQSLVPTMAFRLARPAHLVDINGVEGLDRLAVDGDQLSIVVRVPQADPTFGSRWTREIQALVEGLGAREEQP